MPSARARTTTFGWSLVELPSGQVQLYFRDPGRQPDRAQLAGRRDAGPLEIPGATRLADQVPQSAEALRARLYLDPARPVRARRTRRNAEHDPASVGPARACARGAGAPREAHRDRPPWPGPRLPGHLGALPRAHHRQVRDLVRLGRPRPEGLPDHARERGDRRRALLRRRERLHPHLRADAHRQHGTRRVLPARRLHRPQDPAAHGRGGRRLRADEQPGQPDPLDRPHDRRHRCSSAPSGWRCSRSSCAGTRARISGRR